MIEKVNLEFSNVPNEIASDLSREILALIARKYGQCPKCGKGFKKNRKDQVYCSKKCQNIGSLKEYREKKKEQEKSLGIVRRKYTKRLHIEKGE